MMLVTSGCMQLAMPKSISFREAFTMTKLAGFKSLWTIPARGRRDTPTMTHGMNTLTQGKTWERGNGRGEEGTVLVDGVHRIQHVLPVELPLQRDDGLAVPQPRVQVQAPALHQHVDVAVCDFTAEDGGTRFTRPGSRPAHGGHRTF